MRDGSQTGVRMAMFLQDQSLDPRVQNSYQIGFQVAEMSRLLGLLVIDNCGYLSWTSRVDRSPSHL